MIGGEKKKAIEIAEKALELDPDNLLAKKLLDHIKEKNEIKYFIFKELFHTGPHNFIISIILGL